MSFLDLYQGDQQNAATIQPNEGNRLPSGFEENLHAAWSDGQLFSQSIAQLNARGAALDDYASEVKNKTGFDLTQDVAAKEGGGTPDYDAINFKVAALNQANPSVNIPPISDDELDKRALTKAQAAHRTYQTLQQGEKTWGGSAGTFLGSAASSAADPVNILALAVAPETGGLSILSSALRWGAVAGLSQAAIEASSDSFKEQVQPGYMESGEPLKEIGGAFVGGAVLGGATKVLGNAWTKVKTGKWPTSVRDAGNVVESEANVADSNPFPGVEGEVAHREALVKTIDDILAGNPIQIDHIITQQFLERSRALVEKLQAEEPMRLPVINRRAIELVAEQDKIARRDAELSSNLESIPEGDASAADRLNRLQAVDQQIAATNDIAEKRALNERRDQILVDTNPEKLQAAAAPIEARRIAESERASIADRLNQIAQEHANLQASTLPQMPPLPSLGQRERIPGGTRQLDLPFEIPATEAAPIAPVEPGPQPVLHTPEQMRKVLNAPDHQAVIRGDIDRAIDANAAEGKSEIMVPGLDENGNHTMVGVNKAVDEVDAYKKLADDIQACATMTEAAE